MTTTHKTQLCHIISYNRKKNHRNHKRRQNIAFVLFSFHMFYVEREKSNDEHSTWLSTKCFLFILFAVLTYDAHQLSLFVAFKSIYVYVYCFKYILFLKRQNKKRQDAWVYVWLVRWTSYSIIIGREWDWWLFAACSTMKSPSINKERIFMRLEHL